MRPHVVKLTRPACRHALWQAVDARRQVVEHPVDPGHLRRLRVWRVGVVDDQGQALGASGWRRPGQWRRDIVSFTRVLGGDLAACGKGRRGERKGHGLGSIRDGADKRWPSQPISITAVYRHGKADAPRCPAAPAPGADPTDVSSEAFSEYDKFECPITARAQQPPRRGRRGSGGRTCRAWPGQPGG